MQTTETFILKTIPGYNNVPIFDFRNIALPSDLSLISDRLLINLYTGAMKAVHFMDRNRGDNLVNKPHALRIKDQTRQEVQTRLEAAGWEAHIVDPIAKTRDPTYIHAAGGHLAIHQVTFHNKWNIPLTPDWLYNDDETLVSKEETLARMRKDIGLPHVDLKALVEDGEIDEDQFPYILALIKALDLDLEDIHEVNEKTIQTGAQRWEYREDEIIAEENARSYLEDGELWRQAVMAGNTEQSLEEWIDDVLNADGWKHILGTYNGSFYTLNLPSEKWHDIATELYPNMTDNELCEEAKSLKYKMQNVMLYWRTN